MAGQRQRGAAATRPDRDPGGTAAALLITALIIFGGDMTADPPWGQDDTTPPPLGPESCSDNLDNDNDGLLDAQDPECDPGNIYYDGVEDGDA